MPDWNHTQVSRISVCGKVLAISRTMVAEMNMYCSAGVRNTFSTSG